jgi:TatD DNase family protein
VADAAVCRGFLLGIGGTLTFKNAGVDALMASIGLEHIVLETDAPFLAPVPFRGKRNEPAFVRLIAEKMAAVKGISVEEVARRTTENARRLFRLD